MSVEKTFIFIKPDGVKRSLVGEVLARFEKRGLVIAELKKMNVKRSNIADGTQMA